MHRKSLEQTIAGKPRKRSSMGGVGIFNLEIGK